MQPENRKIRLLVHLTIWLILLILPAYLLSGNTPRDKGFLYEVWFQIGFYCILFYVSYLWLAPGYFFRHKKLVYFMVMAMLIIGMMWGVHIVHRIFEPPFPDQPARMFSPGKSPGKPGAIMPPPKMGRKPGPLKNWPLFNFVLTSVLITGLSLGLRVSEKLSENEKLRKEAEKERLNQELMLLRNQINPHFLFNTLNTIYSLALIRSEHTAEAVMKLSDMMRYVIQDVNRDFVPLALELDYIRQYVGLQKLRLNEMVTTLLEIEGEPGGLDIAPVILVPFVENTFKHGTSAHEQATILIRIILRDTTLEMLTENRIFPGRPSGETFGIGLRNTRKRLELIYPESHELVYGETEGVFRLHLQIRLG